MVRSPATWRRNAMVSVIAATLLTGTIAIAQAPTVDFVFIPAEDTQPNGPRYGFSISRFEIRNDQFVVFLNDALANLDNERGQYMYFDTDNGDVYIHTEVTGAAGANGTGTLFFSASTNPYVSYNDASGEYEVTEGFETHPITGVTWYGAMKYCNWLTIDQGMLPGERCYTEDTDTNLHGWHPTTIGESYWQMRDLTDAERFDLVMHYRGYRLPMDDGYNNTDVTSDSPDDYNEWYKAAAWNGMLGQNTLFGFGRNDLTGADANYTDSGDPLDNGTTPVGYFDGLVKEGSFFTNPNENGFGLFDMTGNAYQWMQGRFNTHPNSIEFRTLRGGSWKYPADSLNLLAASRTYSVPGLTDSQVGFRVVWTLAPTTGDFDLDGDVDIHDFAMTTGCMSGPAETVVPGCTMFDLDTDSDVDLHDFAQFQIVFTGSP